MAGFPFGGGQQQRGDGGVPPSESFFLYGGRGSRSDDLGYTRGFELWQQQAHHQIYSSVAFPDELQLAAARSMRCGGGSSGGGISCQDCGNQAKKDCAHLRCRTCCKSRGFQCSTHVRSTWVPAAKRRERQQQLTAAAAAKRHDDERRRRGDGEGSGGGSGSGSGESGKRPREITATATTSTYGGGGLDPENFPQEVSAEAMFRCVRVSPVDEADDEYAYQTTVSIAGHVFKGILYDHGADADAEHHPSNSSSRYQLNHGESSSSLAVIAAGDAAATVAATASAAHELLDPYPTPLSAFMAGTQFFPHQHRPN
ncbi:hypothetical protein Cni_G27936 [Canna indica]|uniref:Uncharacterized protein n=1 Tax=Canna indica TaxID=4628 RepID=A0AAQ3QPT4_9LILI|nr:hypothetical protein Cni_G27936 [Canna indica]